MSPVFAGREAELAVLGRAFENAGDGVPGTVLVGAEVGGGKSRLVDEFAARVAGRALVLAGGCVELAGTGLPYAPFTAALRGLVRERGPAWVTGLLGGRGAGELAALLPEFGTPPTGADPATARARLFELLLGLFEALAERRPLVLVVLDLWDRVPAAAEHTGADRAGVVELAADAARWAHEPERGLALVEPALDEACESGDPGRRAALLLRRAVLRQQALLPGSADDLETALRLAARPDRLRAEILGQISRALLFEDRHEEARQPAEQMLALATRLGDQECQNEAVITLAQIDVRQGHDSLSALQDARETARRIGSVWHELRAYGLVAHMLEGRGDHEGAIQVGREGLARARQLGLGRFPTAPLVGYTAESLTSAGRWDEALQVISDGLSLDLAPRGSAFLLVLRGRIAVARGEQETAARIVEQLHTLLRSRQANTLLAPPTAILTIEVRLAQGDLAGAIASVRTALAPLPDAEPRYLWPLLATGMRACVDAVPAHLPPEVGGRAELQSALERAAAGIPRPGPVEQAHAAVFDAEASRAAGCPDRAAWDAAAAAWESLGQPYPLAYALLRAAAAAAAAGDRDAAASRLQRAADLAGLRARPLLAQISRLARRAHVEIAGTSPDGPAAPFGLTGRELEVLRLVAAGLGNREIAAELFISPKTASVHVSNILGKLGVASRGEAAATAHRLHIFDPP